MLKIFKEEPKFRFIRLRWLAFALSGLIILAGIYVYATRGFNWGIDFSGGTLIEVGFDRAVTIPQVRARLSAIGLGDAQITRIGGENKFFIKTMAALKRQGRPAGETLEEIEEYEIVAREIRGALMDEGERAQAASGRIDLNNSAVGEIARFLRDKGLGDEDAQETADRVIGLRKGGSGIIRDLAALEQAGVKHRIVEQLREQAFFSKFTFLSVEFVGPPRCRPCRA